MTMKCSNCSREVLEGTLVCPDCGTLLVSVPGVPQSPKPVGVLVETKAFGSAEIADLSKTDAVGDIASPGFKVGGTTSFDHTSRLALHIGDHSDFVEMDVRGTGGIVLGRPDPTTSWEPDVNLIPYFGVELGVSRQHSRIDASHDMLYITDLGSINGTFLNGKRLDKANAHLLRDGDTVHLGRLKVVVYFLAAMDSDVGVADEIESIPVSDAVVEAEPAVDVEVDTPVDTIADGEKGVTRRIRKEVTVSATLDEVWEAWTTEAGVKTFFAPQANVELAIGGAYEMLFNLDAPPGSQGGEGLTILSYLPKTLLSFTWNAPLQYPTVRGQRTWVVIQFVALPGGGVHVVLTHLGWGDGDEWDQVYAYFQSAWNTVLGRLAHRFAVGPIDWDNPYKPE